MEDKEDNWGQYLEAAVFSANTSRQKTTQATPFKMMYSREPRFPLEAEMASEQDVVEEVSAAFLDADPTVYLQIQL